MTLSIESPSRRSWSTMDGHKNSSPFFSLHDDMQATVWINGEFFVPFYVTTGIKQSCRLTPTLFAIFLSAMLDQLKDRHLEEINVTYRIGQDIFLTSGNIPDHEPRVPVCGQCHGMCLVQYRHAVDHGHFCWSIHENGLNHQCQEDQIFAPAHPKRMCLNAKHQDRRQCFGKFLLFLVPGKPLVDNSHD